MKQTNVLVVGRIILSGTGGISDLSRTSVLILTLLSRLTAPSMKLTKFEFLLGGPKEVKSTLLAPYRRLVDRGQADFRAWRRRVSYDLGGVRGI